jgi:hypothetical protein
MLNDSDVAAWVTRIESEYREMPGLLLTEPQMQRLWGLDRTTCEAVISVLVARHVLVKTREGTLTLADRRVWA